MPSSTLPSERIVPEGPWGLTLITALVLTAVSAMGAEAFVRELGYRPSVADTRALWSYHRGRVYAEDGKSIVLLGASRMQAGVSLEVFRDHYPDYRITQLAVSATSPLATLKDLADDEEFVGIVLCSLSPSALQAGVEPDHSQERHVAEYWEHRRSWNLIARLRLQFIDSRFAIARPQFRLRPQIRQLLMGTESAGPDFMVTKFDRSQQLDFQKIDIEKQRARRVGGTVQFFEKYIPDTPDREAWMEAARALKPSVEKLRNRGGRVVFIRFPETGEHWRLSESHYPRTQFWDHLAESTGTPTIHFRDVPGLAHFECPDTSHLDYRDTDAFTNALIDECVGQNVLPKPE
ncbi:MAG: hypothetical protein KDA52_18425 [Planctomycetaceae bacterium]|nr:hypothetical protein [Planctomycetaceae bacterium]